MNKENIKQFINLAILFILILLLIQYCNRSDKYFVELEMLKQNLQAQNDSIRKILYKDSSKQYQKQVFIVNNQKDLEKWNRGLYKELQNIKGNVKQISNTQIFINSNIKNLETKISSKKDTNTKLTDLSLVWTIDTTFSEGNWKKLKGKTNLIIDSSNNILSFNNNLLEDNIGIKLQTGLIKNNKGQWEIFVKSKYPGFNITELEGAIINDEQNFKLFTKKSWKPAIHTGVGLGFGYNGKNLSPVVFGGLSIGISKNIKK